MRSNGLTASSYLPVADLNPSVAEALLGELRDKRIAAYSQPVDSTSVAGIARPEYRIEVLVRLYVDAAATDEALSLVREMEPGGGQRNEDLTWAQIVAGYDAPLSGAVAPWPVYEDLEPDADRDAREALDALPLSAIEQADALRKAADRAAELHAAHQAAQDRFVPPLPPPLPRLSGAEQAAWLGVIGGPALLLVAAVLSLSLPTWLTLTAALGFIGGFVALVVRMDNGEDRLDDPDNGAQV